MRAEPGDCPVSIDRNAVTSTDTYLMFTTEQAG
jgi:hypothetical protein